MTLSELHWNDLTAREQQYKQILWEVNPIAFCEDPYGLGLKLWPMQHEIISEYYTPPINELVLVAGMGGSKTSLLAFLACIELKSLLSVDWTKKLNIMSHSPLFVMLVSVSERQANDAVWNQVAPLIQRSPFFQHYGANLLTGEVNFEKKKNIFLRMVSASSDTAVGRRNKFVGIDEMAKFETTSGPRGGWQVYNDLKAGTKVFKENGRMCVVGSPKLPSDPLMTLYKKTEGQKTVLRKKYATWELNPNSSKKDFDVEFAIDPRKAATNYAAEPTAGDSLYFADTSIFEYHNRPNYLELLYDNSNVVIEHPDYDYILAGDPSLKHDHFGLSLSHIENGKIVFDGHLGIGATREINPAEVGQLIDTVADQFMVTEAVFDTWWYPETMQRLQEKGTFVMNHMVTKADYDNFKRQTYMKEIVLCHNNTIVEEIANLITTGVKVDHPRKGTKDVIDSAVNSVYMWKRKDPILIHNKDEEAPVFLCAGTRY